MTEEPWTSRAAAAAGLELVQLPPAVLNALADGDLDRARKRPEVAVVRATVRPDNIPSRRLLYQYGFQSVGEQWDDEDGLETILEVPCPGS